MCLSCFEKTMNKPMANCPFCRACEPMIAEPDVVVVKRRRIQADEDWTPHAGIILRPRGSLRVTRRMIYIYDEGNESDSVDVGDAEPALVRSFLPPSEDEVIVICDDE
jgi:hypothetical protein